MHRTVGSLRDFYDRFHRFYGFVERTIDVRLQAAVTEMDPDGDRFRGDSVLEHCCGSGSLALAIAPRCAAYEGRDQSEGMLGRARARWRHRFGETATDPFVRENVLEFAAAEDSYDRTMLSYCLHLFPPQTERDLLGRFYVAARKGVIVFDHTRSWNPVLSLIEAVEGGWYRDYVKLDFAEAAALMGAEFRETVTHGVRIMEFSKHL
jgi:ubiquinone/menaquinone biosynthesis C-methylase UbiE